MSTPSQPQFTIHVIDTGDSVLLAACGELDVHTAPGLDRALTPLHTRRCELDLFDVPFADSSGINLLIRHQRRAAAAGGSLHVIAVSRPVRRVLDISGTSHCLLLDAGKPPPETGPGPS
ncbi:STAS domain-containing protein [Streptomyces sp. NPDC052225]|uniref:STAS domain-containing protein n=1 Tax=Streptomyces sp. NPDC052225 TaxID=3154949 RepID=UPI00342F5328